MNPAHDRYRQYLETLSPETLIRLSEYVSSDVRFKDPLNEVHGVDAMSRVFQHMFEHVRDIRFEVRHLTSDGTICLMSWHFDAYLSGKPWQFDGTSVVRFDEDGRVFEHIDYWDVGRDFYERLPFIGQLLGVLRRLLRVA